MLQGICQIKDQEVDSNEFKRKDGSRFTVRRQWALAQFGDEVRKFRIELSSDQAPFPPGKYEYMVPVLVGQYGDLILNMRDIRLTGK